MFEFAFALAKSIHATSLTGLIFMLRASVHKQI